MINLFGWKTKKIKEVKETKTFIDKFNPKKRKDSDKMSDKEKMDKGYNGSTYTINGIDNDFQTYTQNVYMANSWCHLVYELCVSHWW